MASISQKQCPRCKTAAIKEGEPRSYNEREVSEAAYFCYNCGKSLKSRPESISLVKQILVYSVSFFLAPFGLVYAFKYLNQPDRKSKTIGIISLILTVLAIITVILTAKTFIEREYSVINLINSGGL